MALFNRFRKKTDPVKTELSAEEVIGDETANIRQTETEKDFKNYVNPIQRTKYEPKPESGISRISGRTFQKFENNPEVYPVDKTITYRDNILETIPQFIADVTSDDKVKNDQPTLISKRRAINEYGYMDTETAEQQKSPGLKPLISVKDFTMVFKTGKSKKYAVNNISFNINPHEHMALIGANGAGKTTTVETIAGINKPMEGKIEYNFPYKRSFQEGIGIQFQDSSYPRGITVKNVIGFLKDAYGITKEEMSDEEFDYLLDVFKIKEFYKSSASSLSGGQQQRLNVLLSLMHKPKVLFLDELVTGLDIQIRNQLENFINEFTKKHNITVVLVSHDMLEVEKMTSRVVLLQNGIIKVDMYLDEIHYQYGSVDKLVSRYI